MKTGFRTLPVDLEFARRSIRYLASQGLRPNQIQAALVEQLDISDSDADELLAIVAA